MSCGALAADERWVAPKRAERFLFSVHVPSKVFAGKFRAALALAEGDGRLPRDPAAAADARRRRMHRLRATLWGVCPKTPLAGSAALLDYLPRYTHRPAIGHERLAAARADGSGKKTVRIGGAEFVGRFLQHVLPAGFKRIRHDGLLPARHKTVQLAQARTALAMPAPNPIAQGTAAKFMRRVASTEIEHCPHCRGHWRVVQRHRPVRAALWPRAGRAATAALPQAP